MVYGPHRSVRNADELYRGGQRRRGSEFVSLCPVIRECMSLRRQATASSPPHVMAIGLGGGGGGGRGAVAPRATGASATACYAVPPDSDLT